MKTCHFVLVTENWELKARKPHLLSRSRLAANWSANLKFTAVDLFVCFSRAQLFVSVCADSSSSAAAAAAAGRDLASHVIFPSLDTLVLHMQTVGTGCVLLFA